MSDVSSWCQRFHQSPGLTPSPPGGAAPARTEGASVCVPGRNESVGEGTAVGSDGSMGLVPPEEKCGEGGAGQAPGSALCAVDERASYAAGDQDDRGDQADSKAPAGGGQGTQDRKRAGIRRAESLQQDDRDQHVVRLCPDARA